MTVPEQVTPVVDEARLAQLEQDLADAAATLESIEEITAGDLGPAERVSAIDALTSGGRFDVTRRQDPTHTVGSSDLVGNGDLGAVEQFEPFPQDEPPLA